MDNEQKIVPPIAHFLKIEYPDDINKKLENGRRRVIFLDAYKMSLDLGSDLLVNTLLLGVLSKQIELPEKIWQEVLVRRFKKKKLNLNLKAFEIGRSI